MENNVNSLIVTKSNTIVEAKYKLKLEEQRLILYLISLIEPDDEDYKTYKINVTDFCNITNIKRDTQYNSFKRICRSLISKTIIIYENDRTTIVAWLSSATYINKSGTIHVEFSSKLKSYLLQLKNNFTTYKLENILGLKSIYSIRIYELLKQYENLGKRNFYLDKLKDILGTNTESYNNRYNLFKKRVLEVAEKELKEKCDIYFTFDEIKKGKKINEIIFYIHRKKNKSKNLSGKITEPNKKDNTNNKLIKELKNFIKEPLSNKEIITLLEEANNNIELIKNIYILAKGQSNIKNLVGWLLWAINNENTKSDEKIIKMKSNRFANFTQREYDFEKLEKLEREYLEKEDLSEI